MKKYKSQISVARDGEILGEFSILQLPSLIEAGYLLIDDHFLDHEANAWVSWEDFRGHVPGYAWRAATPSAGGEIALPTVNVAHKAGAIAWAIGFAIVVITAGAGVLAWTQWGR